MVAEGAHRSALRRKKGPFTSQLLCRALHPGGRGPGPAQEIPVHHMETLTVLLIRRLPAPSHAPLAQASCENSLRAAPCKVVSTSRCSVGPHVVVPFLSDQNMWLQ